MLLSARDGGMPLSAGSSTVLLGARSNDTLLSARGGNVPLSARHSDMFFGGVFPAGTKVAAAVADLPLVKQPARRPTEGTAGGTSRRNST